MVMQLRQITDPRDNLERARRPELFRFARANNVSEIKEDMPAELMRKKLRDKNLTHIQVPNRVLGTPELAQREAKIPRQTKQGEQKVASVDAVADLERQYQEKAKKPVSAMGMNEMRAECKARGIKMDRRDNMATLRGKLGG